MNRDDQKEFVHDLVTSVMRDVCERIELGIIPAEWDGNELRVFLSEKFEQSARMSVIRTAPRQRRARDYHNTVLTKGLT